MATPAKIIAVMQIGMVNIRTHIAKYLDVMISRAAGAETGRSLCNRIGSVRLGISVLFLGNGNS